MTIDAAVGLLQQEGGRALDPRVVQTFVKMYPRLAAEAETSQEPARKLTRVAVARAERGPGGWPACTNRRSRATCSRTSRSPTAKSTRSTKSPRRWAPAWASSDTMALISSKLTNIVPFSWCALFLYDEENETLQCRFATGIEADVISS